MRLVTRRLVRLFFRRKRSDLRDLAMITIFCITVSAYGLVLDYFGGPLAFRIGMIVPFAFAIAMLVLHVRVTLHRIERANRNQAMGRPTPQASANEEPPGPLRTVRSQATGLDKP